MGVISILGADRPCYNVEQEMRHLEKLAELAEANKKLRKQNARLKRALKKFMRDETCDGKTIDKSET